MLKKLFLLGILAVMVQLFRETAFAVSNQAAPGNPVSPSSTVFQLRDPLLSNLLLPLPPLLLPDLLFPPYDFPSFNSQRLDQELQLYYRYLQRYGRPDVMIVGSSRSLQGV
ncbi:MAG: hypothetical protein MUF49_31690, partial [Oculatellaceae cyanobacterium Prado106]|nr:hypothetical protein [Oculatellaceae cyanobacterium Prado106]